MRHQKFSQRLSRPQGHRRATVRNLIIALIKYQGIKTTKAKAKFAQSRTERLISLGKQDTLHARRQAYKILHDRSAVRQLFLQIAPLFKDRNSGFTRITHLTKRRGDAAEIVYLEFIQKLPKLKPAKKGQEKPAETKAAKKIGPAAQRALPDEREQKKPQLPPKEKPKPRKERPSFKQLKPKKFLGGLRRLFKRERDSL